MQVELNNEIINFKLLPSDHGFSNVAINGEEFCFSLKELEKESIEMANTQNGSFRVKAFGGEHIILPIKNSRKKELKIHARPMAPQAKNQDTSTLKIATAIIMAHKARLSS